MRKSARGRGDGKLYNREREEEGERREREERDILSSGSRNRGTPHWVAMENASSRLSCLFSCFNCQTIINK